MGTPTPPGALSAAGRSLTSDVVVTFGGKVVATAAQIAGAVVVARALGPSGRGAVAVGLTLVLVCVQVGSVGVVAANPYFGARDPSVLGRLVRNSLWIALVMGAILVAVVGGLWLAVPDVLGDLSGLEISLALLGVPAALATVFLQSVLLAEGRMLGYNVVEVAQGLGSLAGLVVVLIVIDGGAAAAIAVLSLGYVLAALSYLVLLRHHAPIAGMPDADLLRRMIAYGLRVYVATLASFLIIRLDLFLVNAFLGEDQAGLYATAAGLADGLFLIPLVVGLNVFPRVARGAPTEVTAAVFRFVTLTYGALCLVSVALADPVIALLYGEEFDNATELYYWLAPGVFSLGLVTILSYHFSGRGFPRAVMVSWFAGLAVNVAINLVFLEEEGAYIASLASSIAYTLLLVLHVVHFAREVGGLSQLWPRPREALALARVALGRRSQ